MFDEIKISKKIKTVLDQGREQLNNIDKMFDEAMDGLDKALDNEFFKTSTNPIDTILSFTGVLPSFPPVNIYTEKFDIDQVTFQPVYVPYTEHVIELALSGYKSENVSIDLHDVDGQKTLAIESAGINDKRSNVQFHQRGIAGRAFKMDFKIGRNVKVRCANLVNGLLTIRLNIVAPVEKPTVEKIHISYVE